MEITTLAFDQARLNPGSVPVVAYVLQTPMGSRLWTQGVIPPTLQAMTGTYFDAEILYDADAYFDGGTGMMELLPRILDFGSIAKYTAPFGSEIIAGIGEGERASFRVSVANEDGKISQFLAEEFVLGQTGRVLMGFLGLDLTDYVEKYRGQVQRWTITGLRQVAFDHLEF